MKRNVLIHVEDNCPTSWTSKELFGEFDVSLLQGLETVKNVYLKFPLFQGGAFRITVEYPFFTNDSEDVTVLNYLWKRVFLIGVFH